MVKGTVSKLIVKDWNGKKFYSVGITNGPIYGCGMSHPGVKEGDLVTFEETTNAKGYPEVVKGSLVIEKGAGPSTAWKGAKAAGVAQAKDDYWTRKESRDIANDVAREIGASRNTAIEWVKFLISHEVYKIPTNTAKKEEFFNALLEDYTTRFRDSKNTDAAKTDPVVPEDEVAPAEPLDDAADWS